MAIDNQQVHKEITLNKGKTIILQGHAFHSLNILHSGAISTYYTDKEVEGKSDAEIINNSLKIYDLEGSEFSFGEYSLIHKLPAFKTIVVRDQAKISIYPFSKERLLSLPKTNPKLTVIILKNLLKKINIAIDEIKKINIINEEINKIFDNLAILLGSLISSNTTESRQRLGINLENELQKIYSQFIGQGKPMPAVNDSHFLQTKALNKDYSETSIQLNTIIDQQLLNFFYTFLKIDYPVLVNHFETLPALLQFPLENLSIILNTLQQTIYENKRSIQILADKIYGTDKSLINFLIALKPDKLGNTPFTNNDFTNTLKNKLIKLKNYVDNSSFSPTPSILNHLETFFAKLSQYQQQKNFDVAKTNTGEQNAAFAEQTAKLHLLKNSLDQILEFTKATEEFQEQFKKLLNSLKELSDKLDTEGSARGIRHKLTRFYWQLYYNAFLRIKSGKTPPLPVQLMLKFGFLDETLVSENNILTLLSFQDTYKSSLDIHSSYEWLEKIYTDEKIPSITELGLTFKKQLLEERKSKTYKEMQELENDPNKLRHYKIQHETTQMITSCARVCSESIGTAFPILIDELLTMDITKTLLYKQQIEEIINSIHDIDFKLFNREVILKTKFRIELIDKEVTPDIIILPTVGAKVMMWQDLETTNKRTKARFAIPQIFTGDLMKSFTLALARFRWEICRTEKGPQWADPIEGGLTGYYFDYINFYKKNPNLSMEAKEKITEHVRSFRSNRERFASDYLTWIRYESKGIAKLNKVLRDIFYRTMPFSKPIREKLKRLPLYENLENKYTNLTNRKLKDLDIKFRKYTKDEEGMPQELTDYLEMLQK